MSLFPVRVTSNFSSLLIPVPEKLLTITGNRNHYYEIWLGLLHTSSKVHKHILKIIKNATPTPPKRNLTSSKKKTETKKHPSPRPCLPSSWCSSSHRHRGDCSASQRYQTPGNSRWWVCLVHPWITPFTVFFFGPLTFFFWKIIA